MTSPADLINVATKAASAKFPAHSVDHVEIESMIASDGSDALRVTVVLNEGVDRPLAGEMMLDTSLAIAWAIEGEGDDRYAFVEYRSRNEPDPDDDPEA